MLSFLFILKLSWNCLIIFFFSIQLFFKFYLKKKNIAEMNLVLCSERYVAVVFWIAFGSFFFFSFFSWSCMKFLKVHLRFGWVGSGYLLRLPFSRATHFSERFCILYMPSVAVNGAYSSVFLLIFLLHRLDSCLF